jgi:methionyl-tRNA formyltransferase
LKIVFAGTPEFAASSLEAIIQAGHKVIAVYTQPDRPAGRGKKLLASPVKQCALQHGIEVFQPESLKDEVAQKELKDLDADLMIVAAYGLILPKAVLEMPKLGCVNIHASLLPRWRGAAPIQRAIQAGDVGTGITIMQMDEGLDTGAMLLRKFCTITEQSTGGSLHDELAKLGAEAILEYLSDHTTLEPEAQEDSLANYAHKLSKEEAKIDWSKTALEIERTIRAFNPWPVAFAELDDTRIRIFEAQADESKASGTQAGTILEKNKTGVLVQCGEGQLRLLTIQLPGSKAMKIADFVNGGKKILEPGQHFSAAK